MASLTSRFAEAKTGVFWDVEGCPILNGLDPVSIHQNIKSALLNQGYRGEVTIKAYKEKQTIRNDFQVAGIELAVAGDRHGRFKMMYDEVLFWMMRNRGSNILIISRDKTDYKSFSRNWDKGGFSVLFAEPANPPERCCKCGVGMDKPPVPIMGSAEWVWTSLVVGGDPLITKNRKEQESIIV